MSLAVNLLRLREKKNISAEKLGKEIGVSKQMIFEYERGESIPRRERLAKFATYFGVSVADLYAEDFDKVQARNNAEDGLIEAITTLSARIRELEEKLRKCEAKAGYKDL